MYPLRTYRQNSQPYIIKIIAAHAVLMRLSAEFVNINDVHYLLTNASYADTDSATDKLATDGIIRLI